MNGWGVVRIDNQACQASPPISRRARRDDESGWKVEATKSKLQVSKSRHHDALQPQLFLRLTAMLHLLILSPV